ncbi:hypothetical protein BD289DRAFT_437539 [Coniella lustricola]|uniref:Uncharacterized protein n=1 Tax=Coniella lustricola TaxID=2025994 RepID=A0A2T3A3T5_9PEZI|nr:hypothetical protein BD289DRAFT_437539 [Coniella lustricola]
MRLLFCAVVVCHGRLLILIGVMVLGWGKTEGRRCDWFAKCWLMRPFVVTITSTETPSYIYILG